MGKEVLEARGLEEDWARLSNLDLIKQNMELLNIFEQRSGVKKGSFKYMCACYALGVDTTLKQGSDSFFASGQAVQLQLSSCHGST